MKSDFYFARARPRSHQIIVMLLMQSIDAIE